ncbi:ABC transporter substrate-binding protein [Lacrimispora saccharolytica]|uniref:Extracellular solute-binding protein family 1 n=1 Tax=Lacrimispora saccharolytica (strain ATCC 35040 / DSM 2544 / NRCC 2533 / WM1) TaxID=610130 RepID=D9R1B9_LACSW|nr:sugar ABC transporter substrate-binding protein [Lacrimispora saccharolytica]ADL04666.1 extracellular solute-binding protein family 1 [[Clostridium] saccharolyticum WM1]QRV21103.1 sugar ABC transporter substrate-binding protein [Lacrimispora saccharolytica]
MKKSNIKKWISFGMAGIMTAGALMGCSSSGSGTAKVSATTQGAEAPQEPSAAGTEVQSQTAEENFDWKKFAGTTLKVNMVQHSVAEAIVTKIPEFEELTGIKVEHSITPEANYFDKVSTALASRTGEPDLFMSGAYQLWDYSAAGYVYDLNKFLNAPDKVAPGYDFADLYPSAVSALQWDGVPGHAVGSGAQLGLPLAIEIYSLAYNKRAFEQAGIEVPKTYDELLAACDKLQGWNGPDSYAMTVRGARDWGTIHPGYMSTYANFGAKDFAIEDDRLVSKVNSPEAVAMTEFWVDMIKRGGSPSWSRYTWYECGADLGAGKAAMMFEADNTGIHQDWEGASAEAGNLAWTVMPLAKEGNTPNSNFWTWSMAMNADTKNADAAWYFMMYFTSKDFALYAVTEKNALDPARTSVINSPVFLKKMESHEGYIDTFEKTIGSTTIRFTPQPYFFETTTLWATTLQELVAGNYASVQEGMDSLKEKQDKVVEDIVISDYE